MPFDWRSHAVAAAAGELMFGRNEGERVNKAIEMKK
jgi:hypothetical protein